jgi:hypothetical protein
MIAGFFSALERSFAYRLAKLFPSGLVRWMDLISDGMDRVVPQAVVTVTYPGPTIEAVASSLPGINAATFTVTHNGTGDVTISYPADTFRPATARPIANATDGTTAVAITCVRGVNNARLFTAAMPAAVPSDQGFVLQIFGQ